MIRSITPVSRADCRRLHCFSGAASRCWSRSALTANGSWAYVGHHENFYDETQKLNPITGKMWNGTSILDVKGGGFAPISRL